MIVRGSFGFFKSGNKNKVPSLSLNQKRYLCTPKDAPKVLIVGGNHAALTLALCLHKRGINCEIVGKNEEVNKNQLFLTKNAMQVYKFLDIDNKIREEGNGITRFALQLSTETKLNKSTEAGDTLGTYDLLETSKDMIPTDIVIDPSKLESILTTELAKRKISRSINANIFSIKKHDHQEGNNKQEVTVTFKGAHSPHNNFSYVVGTDKYTPLIDTKNVKLYSERNEKKLSVFRATIPRLPDLSNNTVVESWFYTKKKIQVLPTKNDHAEISYYLPVTAHERIFSTTITSKQLSLMSNIFVTGPYKFGINSSIQYLRDLSDKDSRAQCILEYIPQYLLRESVAFDTSRNTILISSASRFFPSAFGTRESSDIEDCFWLSHLIATSPNPISEFKKDHLERVRSIMNFNEQFIRDSIFSSSFPGLSKLKRSLFFASTPLARKLRNVVIGYKKISDLSKTLEKQ